MVITSEKKLVRAHKLVVYGNVKPKALRLMLDSNNPGTEDVLSTLDTMEAIEPPVVDTPVDGTADDVASPWIEVVTG